MGRPAPTMMCVLSPREQSGVKPVLTPRQGNGLPYQGQSMEYIAYCRTY